MYQLINKAHMLPKACMGIVIVILTFYSVPDPFQQKKRSKESHSEIL